MFVNKRKKESPGYEMGIICSLILAAAKFVSQAFTIVFVNVIVSKILFVLVVVVEDLPNKLT